jgi:NAD(P)-dependent dehydrogenase (short-subunit alcohol dehydrogenase family)
MKNVAVVTGAAKNIGKGMAHSMLEAGDICILLDKDEAALNATSSELGHTDSSFQYVIDIGDSSSIDRFMEWLKEKQLQVNVLINNVGFESEDSLLSLSLNSIITSNKVNLEGTFYLTSLLAKLMVEQKQGNIIFITSTHSQVVRTHPLYSSAKAATEMFMKESALELAPHNIRVNAVSPGVVEDTSTPNPSKYMPLGFNQQPQDIANSVDFLLSDKARFITGQTIVVDGGFSIAHTHHWIKQDKL